MTRTHAEHLTAAVAGCLGGMLVAFLMLRRFAGLVLRHAGQADLR